ncbi:type I-A CRISPR-associated protein Cas7/Csa2 [Candidatus Bathyarchaeota archaeon]|nr:type I-A CRISPR-associated protein Cas7/Csa2 [Candidatus Bathyarchaeota archaeon]MBS7618157.1 type I-A CRISPR-associated protein Cas7/Csa2 [Candidatus Bathyarchaeota archaeon]
MYVRLSGRIRINAASLNAQGTVGNLLEITKLRILVKRDESYEPVEVSAVSGNTMKHWHFVHFIDQYLQNGGNDLCDDCKRGVAFRTRFKKGNDEANYIKECAAEDVHGFLMPDTQVRRESLVKFSFLLPVEELFEHPIDTITHNRVIIDEGGKIEGQAGMMIFKRQYASDIYGFSFLADLADIGLRLYSADKRPIYDSDERKRRAKSAILAFIPMLSGLLGANISRSLPALQVEELLVAYSRDPLPLTTHGFFKNYVEETMHTIGGYCKLIKSKAKILIYGAKISEELIKECKEEIDIESYLTWQEIFKEIVEEVDKVEW